MRRNSSSPTRDTRKKSLIEEVYTDSTLGDIPRRQLKKILKVLRQVESNAEFKGLTVDNLRVIHLAAQRARLIKKYIPRAFGRSSPYFDLLTHIEVAVEEK